MNPFKQSFKQLQQQQQWLAVLIFALVAILIWVAVSLISSQKKTGISKELRDLALPLTPTINREVIGAMEAKRFIFAEELQDFPIYTIYRDPKSRTEQVILKGQEPVIEPEITEPTITEPEQLVATDSGTIVATESGAVASSPPATI